MPEITKITTPMVTKENASIKLKPITDQAFALTDPNKVHKGDNEGKTSERQADTASLMKDSMGRPAMVPLLKNSGDMMQVLKKIAFLVEMGVSASDAAKDISTQELLKSLFVSPKEFLKVLKEQDNSSVLFKGESFDVLRDIMSKFSDNPKIRDAVVNMLKAFDYNVSSQNSVKTILYSSFNLLDSMFSKDRGQFANYLKGLAEMLLPPEEAKAFIKNLEPQTPQQAQNATQGQAQATAQGELPQQAGQTNAQGQPVTQGGLPQQAQQTNAQGQPITQGELPQQAQQTNAQGQPIAQGELPQQAQNQAGVQQNPNQQQSAQAGQTMPEQAYSDPLNPEINMQKFGRALEQQSPSMPEAQQLTAKEAAKVLKNNLLPLLGEIVVKYNQNSHIRDVVMVVVHNIARVDQGSPEALRDSVNRLVNELKELAQMPKGFEKQLLDAITQNVKDAQNMPNSVISKLSDVVAEALRSPDTNPAVQRQAENMLMSMLQNQSSMMDILHFVVPFQTQQGQVFTELYVDPETEEKVGKQKGDSHKIFLSVESEAHGSFELSFLETNDHVDFTMWCPNDLVQSLSGLKKHFADIMQLHGYTMNAYKVDEMKAPHSVAEVFPRLIEKRVGIDVHA